MLSDKLLSDLILSEALYHETLQINLAHESAEKSLISEIEGQKEQLRMLEIQSKMVSLLPHQFSFSYRFV